MLNEERIKLMTKLALYEQGEGKKAIRTNKYSKGDYVGLNIIKTLFFTTIAYLSLLFIWVLFKVDYYMQNFSDLNIWKLGIILIISYIVFMVFYLILSYHYYSKKYRSIKKSLGEYNSGLKQLHRMYRVESKMKEEKGLGGSDKNDDPFGN